MKRFISVILSIAVLAGAFSFSSFAAEKKIKSLKIVTAPTKTVFYKNTDWVYGLWDINESGKGKVTLKSSDKISFTHNPGGGTYPERGMIDMSGLEIEVTYTDNSKTRIKYKETKNSAGFYTSNIAVAPKDGKDFFIGTNTLEVYLTEDYHYYDTYKIKITDEAGTVSSATGDINSDKKVNSQDALLVMQHSVGLISLNSTQKKNADMNADGKINSTDALMILKKAVN